MANNMKLKLKMLSSKFEVKCLYCNDKLGSKITLDHVLPKSMGGTDHIKNLALCCRSCNQKKNNLLLTQFIKAFDIKITKEIEKYL